MYDLDAKDSSQPLVRSTTLFHAGKVYDVIWAAGEATVLEPTHRRIWVLNTTKKLVTNVDFDELKHLIMTAEDRLAQQIQELERQPTAPRAQLEMLRFQLHPQFEVNSKASAGSTRLLLTSSTQSYEVNGQPLKDNELTLLQAYLNYADWACRLNYVLHPQPVFPTARLELNDRLRHSKLMPLEVTLRVNLDRPLRLQARHELDRALSAPDRECIHRCESLLRDSQLQKVTLAEYQRNALSQPVGKR